jgi:phosphodiesterase/alkaline phosphatase D-like protein
MFKTDTAAQPAPSPTALTRRGLFTLAGASAAVAAAPLAATSFGKGFTHNVASGEPATDKVMLWTRYVSDKPAYLAWEMSESEDFAKLAAEGSTGNPAGPDSDFCTKTWADGLMPGRWYFLSLHRARWHQVTGWPHQNPARSRCAALPHGGVLVFQLRVRLVQRLWPRGGGQ